MVYIYIFIKYNISHQKNSNVILTRLHIKAGNVNEKIRIKWVSKVCNQSKSPTTEK